MASSMAVTGQQSVVHAMLLMPLARRIRLLTAVGALAAGFVQDAHVEALNKLRCWLALPVVSLRLLKTVVARELSAMASHLRAVYERGSPPRSPTRFSGSIIKEAAAKGNCIFLLNYSPERLAKTASLRRGIAWRCCVSGGGNQVPRLL
jgi:hypothetical protein